MDANRALLNGESKSDTGEDAPGAAIDAPAKCAVMTGVLAPRWQMIRRWNGYEISLPGKRRKTERQPLRILPR
jgi:hypothetical protein